MNIFHRILPAAFFCAALCLPLCAQDEEADGGEAPQQQDTQPAQTGNGTGQQPAAKKAPPKTAAKAAAPAAGKKTAKKKAAVKKEKPVSEYKFSSDPTPTYKFDKRSDPIVKEKKKKKTAAKKSDGSAKDIPKLKKVKSFNETDTAGAGDAKLPDGVHIPGAGGQ